MRPFLKWVLVITVLVFVSCGRRPHPAVTIDGIAFSSSEFIRAFRNSRFAEMGAEGRKQFIDEFIANKLILKEALRRDLDKEPDFLQEIQNYWEQALMRLMLEYRSQEMLAQIAVTDKEIHDYYNQFKDAEFANMKLADVHQQIKWTLSREKQRRLVSAWVESLKADADIAIDYDRLGILQPRQQRSE